MPGAATEKARLLRLNLDLGISSCWEIDKAAVEEDNIYCGGGGGNIRE